MAQTIGNIIINIAANTTKLEKGLKGAKTNIAKFNIAYKAFAAAAVASFGTVINAGIKYRVELESMQDGIRSLILTTSSMTDSNGHLMTSIELMNLARQESINIMTDLQALNKRTPVDLATTARMYKAMLPSMKAAGASQQDLLNITEKLSIAAKNYGLSNDQMLAGIDNISTGTVEANSEFGRMMKTIGLSNKNLKETANVIDLVKLKLKDFKISDTTELRVSNMNQAWLDMSGNIVQATGALSLYKSGLGWLTDAMNYITGFMISDADKEKAESTRIITIKKDQYKKQSRIIRDYLAEIKRLKEMGGVLGKTEVEAKYNELLKRSKYEAEKFLKTSEKLLEVDNKRLEAQKKLAAIKTPKKDQEHIQKEKDREKLAKDLSTQIKDKAGNIQAAKDLVKNIDDGVEHMVKLLLPLGSILAALPAVSVFGTAVSGPALVAPIAGVGALGATSLGVSVLADIYISRQEGAADAIREDIAEIDKLLEDKNLEIKIDFDAIDKKTARTMSKRKEEEAAAKEITDMKEAMEAVDNYNISIEALTNSYNPNVEIVRKLKEEMILLKKGYKDGSIGTGEYDLIARALQGNLDLHDKVYIAHMEASAQRKQDAQEALAASNARKQELEDMLRPYQDQLTILDKLKEAEILNNALKDEGLINQEKYLQNLALISKAIRQNSQDYKDQQMAISTLNNILGNTLVSGFRSSLDGMKSFSDTFKSMIKDMITQLWKIYVVKKITGFISGSLGGADTSISGSTGGSTIPDTSNVQATSLRALEAPIGHELKLDNKARDIQLASIDRKPQLNMVINNNAPGVQAETKTDADGNMEIIISKIVDDIARGTGPIGSTMEQRYGLNKA